ncbi:hypothetical protein SLA2020_295730 [Shorea laevis]
MANRCFHYSALPVDDDDDYDLNREEEMTLVLIIHQKPFDKIPWKSIALAVLLLCLGSLLLFLSFCILTGHRGGEHSQAYGLVVLRILTFLPGFHETRISYHAWRIAEGYHFASIPDYSLKYMSLKCPLNMPHLSTVTVWIVL